MIFNNRKYCWYVFFILMYPLHTNGQNLVPNPGFESYSPGINPYGSSKGYVVDHWYSPTGGTPDFFIKWSMRKGDKDNWSGFKAARNGKCYMGIVTRYIFEAQGIGNHREYIQVKLKSRMIKNQKYEIMFHALLAPNSLYATDGLGVFVSKAKIDTVQYEGCLPLTPQINSLQHGILENNRRWKRISGIYIAKGGEEYITIGNFYNNFNTQYSIIENVKKYNQYTYAYYFLDDVAVIPVTYFDEDLAPGNSIILNLLFASGDAELLSGSINELAKLVNLMNEYPALTIEISGHTDNQGEEAANLLLSQERAKAVADYLLDQGISKYRITYVGYGSKYPIASNESEKGRRENRRVEFKIIKI